MVRVRGNPDIVIRFIPPAAINVRVPAQRCAFAQMQKMTKQ